MSWLWDNLVDYVGDFVVIWTTIVVLVLAYRLVKNFKNITLHLANVPLLLVALIYLTIRTFPSLARMFGLAL
ncbi:hypothetical protein M434DRAFT_34918 [Hypoxylon sp. CO27-5]|nr:hypothetical protein M434DRAFT_34918 [Hypoxylon sp. CO27-5]